MGCDLNQDEGSFLGGRLLQVDAVFWFTQITCRVCLLRILYGLNIGGRALDLATSESSNVNKSQPLVRESTFERRQTGVTFNAEIAVTTLVVILYSLMARDCAQTQRHDATLPLDR